MTASGRLLLTLAGRRIVRVEGDRSLLPRELHEPLGHELLEIVHPVERASLEGWFREMQGCSPPFRRAEADDPARWFRLTAAGAAEGDDRPVLLEEVTAEIREADLRHRLLGIMARLRGEAYLERVPALARELVGGASAALVDVHGPLGVVRHAAGPFPLAAGAALTIAGSPVEAARGSGALVAIENGLTSRYGSSPLVRRSGAQGALVVPVRFPGGSELRAAMVVLTDGRRRIAPWERELLELLGTRTGVEIASESGGGEAGAAAEGDGGAAAIRLLGAQGAVNAFGNLLAAIGLNSELALGEAILPETVRVRLERISESVSRGRKLVRLVDLLSAPPGTAPSPTDLDRVTGELVDLLPLCAEGLEVVPGERGGSVRVWAPEGTLLAVLATLLLAAANSIPQGVRAEIMRTRSVETPAGPMVPVLVRIAPRTATFPEDAWRRLSDTVRAVEPVVAAMGGTLSVATENDTFQVEIQLLGVEEDQ